MESAPRGEKKHLLYIGVTLVSTLIVLFLLSTVLGPSPDNFPSGVLQGGATDSSRTDSIPDEAGIPVLREPPEFWLQARGGGGGNAGWGQDVVAPFDTLWHLRSNGGREFFSSPAIVEGILYLGCNDGKLRAVNATTGSTLWSYSTPCGICGEPAVNDDAVFFGGQDGVIYAIDRASGSKIWSAGIGHHVFCDTGIMNDSLILSGNSIGKICALRADDGEPVWDSDMGGIVLGPAVLENMAVFSTESGKVSAYDDTGARLWSRNFSGQASPPSTDNTGVYLGFSGGSVRKLSISDGSIIWETDIVDGSSRCVLARPVAVENTVLVGTNDSRLICLNSTTGTVLWEQKFENWLQLPPAVGNGTVYLSCDDQRMHLIDLETGSKMDSLELGGYSGTAPVLYGTVLFYGNTSGDFVALQGTVEIIPETPGDTDMEEQEPTVEEDPAADADDEIPEETPPETGETGQSMEESTSPDEHSDKEENGVEGNEDQILEESGSGGDIPQDDQTDQEETQQ